MHYDRIWKTMFASTLLFFSPLYRLKKGKQLEKEEAITEVKKNIHLIKAPHAGKMFHQIIPRYTQETCYHVQGI